MHDPMTQAFDFPSYEARQRWPWLPHLVTVWHVDPERDGSDDSCDWFGGKNLPPATVKRIEETFLFEGRDGGAMSWFGDKKYSPDLIGVGLSMFRVAANCHFGHWSRRAERFLRRHTFDILFFIDNGCDSINAQLRDADAASGEERAAILKRLARVVLAWIVRADRPWWRHPRWHVWHWRLQIHPLQSLRRRLFTRCEACGGRFRGGESAVGRGWDAPPRRWFEWFRSERHLRHTHCDRHPHAEVRP